jgi:hypothetical protein
MLAGDVYCIQNCISQPINLINYAKAKPKQIALRIKNGVPGTKGRIKPTTPITKLTVPTVIKTAFLIPFSTSPIILLIDSMFSGLFYNDCSVDEITKLNKG